MKKYLMIPFFVLTWFICVSQTNYPVVVSLSYQDEILIHYDQHTGELLFEAPDETKEPIAVNADCVHLYDECISFKLPNGSIEISIVDCWKISSMTYTEAKYDGIWRYAYDFLNHQTLICE